MFWVLLLTAWLVDFCSGVPAAWHRGIVEDMDIHREEVLVTGRCSTALLLASVIQGTAWGTQNTEWAMQGTVWDMQGTASDMQGTAWDIWGPAWDMQSTLSMDLQLGRNPSAETGTAGTAAVLKPMVRMR